MKRNKEKALRLARLRRKKILPTDQAEGKPPRGINKIHQKKIRLIRKNQPLERKTQTQSLRVYEQESNFIKKGKRNDQPSRALVTVGLFERPQPPCGSAESDIDSGYLGGIGCGTETSRNAMKRRIDCS
ncbi:hypothetical protein VTN49DRAFT_4326 [Thermomyces lanuginosus]|uniref:uncharacterized protein n=1 Tax=Thermomyces lanuginosus TaxID=5541 RepID=UPI00374221F3